MPKEKTTEVAIRLTPEEKKEIKEKFQKELEKYEKLREAIEALKKEIPEEAVRILEWIEKYIWFTVVPKKEEEEE
ncbi:MAG: hypothetical protein QXK88_10640 [Desulfurococcaceae archaeon]